MAKMESPQIQVLVDSVRDRGEHHSHNVQQATEQTPILGTSHRRSGSKSKLRRACCVKSKAALAILCWNGLVSLFVGYMFEFAAILATDISHMIQMHLPKAKELHTYAPAFFGFLAIIYLFYPLAGCLADIKCGRYKTVLYSLWFITCSGVFICIGTTITCYFVQIISLKALSSTVLLAVGLIGLIVLLPSYITFDANVIQFGMDQLHNSPSEDSTLFIHWLVFSTHFGFTFNKCIVLIVYDSFSNSVNIQKVAFVALQNLVPITSLIAIGISSWVIKHKRRWFLIDTGSRNPYKLVYRVVKFAVQHKTPIRRSAFTYCEDELPSRMDLGKEKYGGPFTTEQVEDVKAFLGLLCLLLTLGPLFATTIAANYILYKFSIHLHFNVNTLLNSKRPYLTVLFLLFRSGGLTELLIVTLIPTYICLLRPFIHYYIPGMLKRIGLGMILVVFSLLCPFLIDTVGHTQVRTTTNTCFIQQEFNSSEPQLAISVWYLAFPYVLNGVRYMLVSIATLEFICAQSPHAMKGLIIGTFFVIRGIFELFGATVLLIPFLSWHFESTFPSCGFVYYLINILIALTGLVAYTWVTRRYQYRQRDEPDNIYRYAEEYYDRAQDDHFHNSYDYTNDYDNLNVHTINKYRHV